MFRRGGQDENASSSSSVPHTHAGRTQSQTHGRYTGNRGDYLAAGPGTPGPPANTFGGGVIIRPRRHLARRTRFNRLSHLSLRTRYIIFLLRTRARILSRRIYLHAESPSHFKTVLPWTFCVFFFLLLLLLLSFFQNALISRTHLFIMGSRFVPPPHVRASARLRSRPSTADDSTV